MSDITIYYNPFCVISRNALCADPPRRRRAFGHRLPEDPAFAGEPARASGRDAGTRSRAGQRCIRPTGPDLGLCDAAWTDDALPDLVLERLALLNRPIVVTPLGTKLCRPSETLLELLPVPRLPPFVKEDGSVVVDRGLRRW